MNNINLQISIPADNDGFVLLKCPLCGEFFKLKADEIEAEDVINIWCPCCGLISDSYITEEVITLALNKAKNIVNDLIFDEFKKLENHTKGNLFSFKAGNKPKRESENQLVVGIEALEIRKYKCCKKEAKIKPLVKICGSYCPYCGVRYDEFE